VGAGVAALLTEAIGLLAAAFPERWLMLFGADATMLEAGSQYLRAVGPFYGFFGLGLALYFGSQGAGRLAWPVIANVARLAVAAAGGWVAWRLDGGLLFVFLAQSAALIVFGVINAAAVAGGAWFQRGLRLDFARAARVA
jgi:Na+-driven multidrug efflux pump